MNAETRKLYEAATKGILAEHDALGRVRQTTVRCDHCGLVRVGEMLRGSTCERCEAGRFVNVAMLREVPE